jgi:hypothetical protein
VSSVNWFKLSLERYANNVKNFLEKSFPRGDPRQLVLLRSVFRLQLRELLSGIFCVT